MEGESNRQPPQISHIGKYKVLDELGRGGMGVVWRGIDENIGREVAIKTLTRGFVDDPDMLARFYDEVRTTGRLNHPNIVTVYHLGDENGIPYIVMERLEGSPLDKLMASGELLSLSDRLRIVEDICSALSNAHQNNVIHRDVKPANIFVQLDGNVKLLDFGIARLEKRDENLGHTRTGNVIGTVPYMAPERLMGSEVDSRSDIFSIGVVLYELITGQLPFEGKDVTLMQNILHQPYPPLDTLIRDYPKALEQIVDRALAKVPDDRYSTAEELAADLNTVNAELKVEQVQRLIPEARRRMEAKDLAGARTLLQQVLRIQRKNADAREMLAEVQRHLSAQQLETRIQQIRKDAEQALEEKHYDRSLVLLQEWKELDSGNVDLTALLDKVQAEKSRQERINGFLRQADSARKAGDYKTAINAAQRALDADQGNSKIVALCSLLTREAEQAQRREQARSLLDQARSEIGSRRFADAITHLKEIEQIDPTNPELPLLLGDAQSGLDQLRCKEVIARLEDQLAIITSYEQLQQVSHAVEEAMVSMPAEAALLRVHAEVARQIKEYEDRRLADETIHACRDLRPQEALERVRATRLRLPNEERLIALERMLQDRVKRQSVDERRQEYLGRSRDALKAERFAEAARILSMCQHEGIATEEMQSLLQFAEERAAEEQRKNEVRGSLARGQALVQEGAYEEAIRFLEVTMTRTDDTALRLLLNEATEARQSHEKQIEAALASASSLSATGKLQDAIQFLELQPRAVVGAARIQMALELLRDQSQQVIFRTIGRAYATSETDLALGEGLLHRASAVSADPALTGKMNEAFRTRLRARADRLLGEVMGRCQMLLRDRNRDGAQELALSASPAAVFASDRISGEWKKLVDRIGKADRPGRSKG